MCVRFQLPHSPNLPSYVLRGLENGHVRGPLPDPPVTVGADKSQVSPQATPGREARKGEGRSGRGKARATASHSLASAAQARSYAAAKGKESRLEAKPTVPRFK